MKLLLNSNNEAGIASTRPNRWESSFRVSENPAQPLAFVHELVRQTLLADISIAHKQRLHGEVADGIERIYPDAIHEHAGEIVIISLRPGLSPTSRNWSPI
jgi:hypothetical protein